MASLTPRGGHTKSIRNTSIVIIENEELIKNITEYTYEYMYILKKRLSSVWVNIAKAFNSSFRNGIDNTIERIDRITSYNVCYTKLLRIIHKMETQSLYICKKHSY